MSVAIPGKIVFLANPRTGSQAVTKYLVDTFPEAIWTEKRHHCTLIEFAGLDPRLLGCPNFHLENEVTCTTVRNHWDTIVTWYLLMYPKQNVSLEWFIWNGEHDYFARGNQLFWLHHADVYLRYETLKYDLGYLLGRKVVLPVVGATEEKDHYKNYYNKNSWEAVRERFLDEIIAFGYANETFETTSEKRA